MNADEKKIALVLALGVLLWYLYRKSPAQAALNFPVTSVPPRAIRDSSSLSIPSSPGPSSGPFYWIWRYLHGGGSAHGPLNDPSRYEYAQDRDLAFGRAYNAAVTKNFNDRVNSMFCRFADGTVADCNGGRADPIHGDNQGPVFAASSPFDASVSGGFGFSGGGGTLGNPFGGGGGIGSSPSGGGAPPGSPFYDIAHL